MAAQAGIVVVGPEAIQKLTLTPLIAAAIAIAATSAAGAANLSAPVTRDTSCTQGERSGAAVAKRTFSVPGPAQVSVRMSGAGGDWDLAVYDAAGRRVAGSAYPGGEEIAQGFAAAAGELTAQACRRSGSDETAELSIDIFELTEQAPPLRMARVATPTKEAEDELAGLGLDLTEHGGADYLDVVLHSPAEAALLSERGFAFEIIDPDLLQTSLDARAAERRTLARARRGTDTSAMPSGRTGTYRELSDYSEELQALAQRNPKLVRYFQLPFETYEGRPVEAIEVGSKIRRKDGRPAFLMLGAHHAREWPSAEHTLEFAYDLLDGWKSKDKRIRRLMRKSRVVFVPVVNPDGFNTSRGAAGALAAGRDAPGGDETPNLLIAYEYHRKNCRFEPPQEEPGGSCTQPQSSGVAQFGVDPNRNYGGLWGGPGASAADTEPLGSLAQDYRGPGPFSEPETRNIERLVLGRQVVTLITNHTFSNLVLFPPGLQSQGKPPDDQALRELGARMAAQNGYADQAGFELYDTSGTTEDWSYGATGGFGYTFEIGPSAFHPSYASVIAEYHGTTDAAGAGGGNRAAYLVAMAHTATRKQHSLIRGKAPRRRLLTITKKFRTATSPVIDGNGEPGAIITFPERLSSSIRVSRRGRFNWHVNPSTRPVVDPKAKRPKPRRGRPSDPVAFNGDGSTTVPCADANTEDPSCWNDHPFTVPGGKGIDNGTATIRVAWATSASDYDIKVFRDSNGDGSSEGETKVLGASADGPSTDEETTLARPGLRRGKYVVRVVNFAGGEPYDGSVTFGKTPKSVVPLGRERYTLTCRKRKGSAVLARRKVFVARGKVVRLDLRSACRG